MIHYSFTNPTFLMCRQMVCYRVEHNFSDVLQPIIMSLSTWSLLAISGVMLMIQVELIEFTFSFGNENFSNFSQFLFFAIIEFPLHYGNVIPLLLLIINGSFAFATVFIACEIGQQMNDAFEKIYFTVTRFKWYLFPIEIRRLLPIIMANAQQPVSLECFGSIICSREVFKKVSILHLKYLNNPNIILTTIFQFNLD